MTVLKNLVEYLGEDKLKEYFKVKNYGTHYSIEVRFKLVEENTAYTEILCEQINELLIDFLKAEQHVPQEN